MTEQTCPTIEISDIGPVEEFRHELNEPGVHVLKGKPGSGKTTILRTIELATSGRTDVRPTKRDGSKGGKAAVVGKTLKIARVVREEGELGIEGLGDLDLNTLHSPKFNDASTRDKYRIKTLARLAGAEANLDLFRNLLNGTFDDVIDEESVVSDDLVEMAAKVKRAIEKAALAAEKKAETARANQQAKRDACKDLDLKAPSDEAALADALSAAIAEHSRLREQAKAGETARAQAAEARRQLESAPQLSVDEAEQALSKAINDSAEANQRITDLAAALAKAQAEHEVLVEKSRSAKQQLEAAKKYEDMAAQWRKAIETSESVSVPSTEDLEKAAAEIEAAKAACNLGAQVRNALQASKDAELFAAHVTSYEKSAEAFRKAAAAAYDVVTKALGEIDCPLKVWNDEKGDTRLVIATDRSEREPFDELSDGERWKVILPIAFKSNRAVVLSQAAWGEISPANRKMIDELAREQGCYVITAQVDDGELRCERFA